MPHNLVQFSKLPAAMKEGQDSLKCESANNSGAEEVSNVILKRKSGEEDEASRKKNRKTRERKSKVKGMKGLAKRRHSLSKAARDPRDEASPLTPVLEAGTRSPSPVIDFDGLSRHSKWNHWDSSNHLY
jgi:GTP cyclohydrolase I